MPRTNNYQNNDNSDDTIIKDDDEDRHSQGFGGSFSCIAVKFFSHLSSNLAKYLELAWGIIELLRGTLSLYATGFFHEVGS